MFDKLIEKVKAEPKKIVFTEGSDARIQEAAARLLAEGLMGVVLVGNEDEVKAARKYYVRYNTDEDGEKNLNYRSVVVVKIGNKWSLYY